MILSYEFVIIFINMESTVSVSKGVFLFNKGWNKKPKQSKSKKNETLFKKWFNEEPWYTAYRNNWKMLENRLMDLNNRTYSVLLNDIVNYIKSFYSDKDSSTFEGIVPSATLLTGVNQPDHVSQFMALVNKIREEVTPHIAMVQSQDAPTVKHLIENVVWQLVHDSDQMDAMDTDLDDSYQQTRKFRKSQCTMAVLQKWYKCRYSDLVDTSPSKKKKLNRETKSLVVIIPDFESFHSNVLQDFVMIISSYVPALPLTFVFGVATSVSALHKSFPYQVSSKLLIKVFCSHSSPVFMNQVLEEIFLRHTSPFHLTGRAYELLTDVFLFYDFSVKGLVQSIKYCMMEHYYGDNTKSLCCPREKLDQAVENLTAEDLETIRQLPSFRPYLESQDCRTKIALFEDDEYLRQSLREQLNKLHDYLYSFYTCLRIFSAFVVDLPKNVLGKSVREMYTKCATSNITETEGFKECMQLLNFQSQMKLVDSMKSALKVINSTLKIESPIKPLRSTPTKSNLLKENLAASSELGEGFLKTVRVHLLTFLRCIQSANTEAAVRPTQDADDSFNSENTPGNRYKLKEQLLKATRVDRIESEYEMVRSRLVSYLEEMFCKGLQPPHTRTYHEIYFFSDVSSVKKQIVGSPRGAVHTALSNPVHYLQCVCCRVPAESVASSLPDAALAYKLHREAGRLVNLYDWLQAFAAVLQPPDDEHEERRHVDAALQVRFTRAVAELQFLGFIKSSKRKTDHVMRLTW